jgi:hypothetical protein
MSDDKDHGFADADHNSGENVPQADLDEQPGISGWQGAVEDQAEPGDSDDPDRPAVE